MNILTIGAWDKITEEIDELILDSKPDVINFIWQHEFEIRLSNKILKYLEKNKTKTNLITCAANTDKLKYHQITRLNFAYQSFNIQTWPLFWILRSHHCLKIENWDLYTNIQDHDFKYPFLSFNNRTKNHRSKLIDQLYRYQLLDKGIVTYHQEGIIAKFEYYPGEKISIDDNFKENYSSFLFNEKFLQSFLHIPTECSIQMPVISEKTAIPILCKLPFLVLGSVGFHQELKNLGFELYDELFDYGFDSEPNLDIRIFKLLKNIHFITDNQSKLQEFYNLIKPKIDHNYQLAMKYITSYDLLPQLIKDQLEYIDQTNERITGTEQELVALTHEFTDRQIIKPNLKVSHGTKYLDLWDNFEPKKIIDLIENFNPDKFIIFGENEWEPWVDEEVRDLVNAEKIKLIFVTGARYSEWFDKCAESLGVDRFAIEYWPTFHFYYAERTLKSILDHKNYAPYLNFKYPFICLNNNAHMHRCFLIDEIFKNNLQDKGAISWHDIHDWGQKFDFKYFDRRKIRLSDDFENKKDSYMIPIEQLTSFFNFVSECCHEVVMISEKTVKPLLYKQPFAVIGGKGFSDYLKELGFELYDEIIDYSYDQIDDLELRVKKYVENFDNILKINNYTDTYKKLQPKIIHNYNQVLKLIKDQSFIPPSVNMVMKTIPPNENLPINKSQIKYRDYLERINNL